MTKRYVAVMQDGAIDELISVMLLASMEDVSMFYIDILNADCIAYPTYQVTQKMLKMIGQEVDLVFISNARGWNPFPWTYRQYSMMVNLFPMINDYQSDVPVPPPIAPPYCVDKLNAAKAADSDFKVTFVVLSPLTDMADIVASLDNPADIIESIIWMGGVYSDDPTVLPTGNIDTGIAPGANPNAEWNAYWDPYAVDTVMKSGVPFYMFPLNVTNSVLLTPEIIRQYFLAESSDYPMLDLASQMYATVAFEAGFSFWDSVTTAYVDRPDLFTIETKTMSIDTDINPQTQGTIKLDPNGYPVQVATSINVQGFYTYLTDQLKTLPVAGWPPGP